MQKVDEIMTIGCECVGEDDSIHKAASRMRQLGIGALPIRGNDDTLIGIITDRDIVLEVVALGKDASSVRAGQLADGAPVIVRADDSLQKAAEIMDEHKVRRLPVVDSDNTLCGMISLGDLSMSIQHERSGALLHDISES
jgi:CBS domain-containing protein